MRIRVSGFQEALEEELDLLGVAVVEEKLGEEPFKSLAERYPALSRAAEAEGFKGSDGQSLLFYPDGRGPRRIFLLGVGGEVDLEKIRVAAANTALKARETGSRRFGLLAPWDATEKPRCFEEASLAAHMALYEYTRYKSEKSGEGEKPRPEELVMIGGDDEALKAAERGRLIAEAVALARDVGNAPPSDMNPEGFEREARRLAEEKGLVVKVLYKEDLEKLSMNGILGVGRGSGVPPRLVVLEYWGAGRDKPPVAVVGKGVTFDSGGLGIKRHESMMEMKYDKCGAATVLGLMKAVADLRLPVNIVGLMPLAENMPGENAYKFGDILRMYNGMTVEIGHTDAEGRLLLADALAYAVDKYKPSEIIDLATLTGSIVIALGNHGAGLYANNEELAEKLLKAAEKTGEKLWRMPLWKEYYEQLKSQVADINNVGGRWGGAGTAAAFLSKFVGETPWAHLDIAGTAWVQKDGPKKPYYPKGATGYALRLILEHLRSQAPTHH